MKQFRWLKWTLAAVLVAGGLRVAANEITDLSTTDANNTGTAANAGFPEGMAPSDVNNASRALEGMIARWYEDWRGAIVATGTGNAIQITALRDLNSVYEDGLLMAFEATASNTGAATLAIDGLTAITIKKNHDQDLISGDIESGQKVIVVYNADEDAFQMLTQTAVAPGFSDPMTTRGDSIIRNSSNTTARLAVGGANTVYISDGTDPSWGSVTTAAIFAKAITTSKIADGIDGELWTWGADAVATTVTAGIIDQVLTSRGAGAAPEFRSTLFSAPDFTSSEQAVTVDTLLEVAHGLATTPIMIQVILRNTTADLNYTPIEEIVYYGNPVSISTDSSGATVVADSTNVSLVQGEFMRLHDKSGFNQGSLTTSSWRWIVKAWK